MSVPQSLSVRPLYGLSQNLQAHRAPGMTEQLNLTSLQYSNASMSELSGSDLNTLANFWVVFFVPYVVFEVPSNLL